MTRAGFSTPGVRSGLTSGFEQKGLYQEVQFMTEKKVRVTFNFSAPHAEKVFLAGSFNMWSTASDPMKKNANGLWEKIKYLPEGTWEYKFFVDGEWVLDPECGQIFITGHGAENSVIEVRKK